MVLFLQFENCRGYFWKNSFNSKMAQWNMVLVQLLLEHRLYKTIPKISLGLSNWSSLLSAIKHLFQFTHPPLIYLHPAFLPILCPNGRSCHSIFQSIVTVPINAKNTRNVVSVMPSLCGTKSSSWALHMKGAFIHTSKENSCEDHTSI